MTDNPSIAIMSLCDLEKIETAVKQSVPQELHDAVHSFLIMNPSECARPVPEFSNYGAPCLVVLVSIGPEITIAYAFKREKIHYYNDHRLRSSIAYVRTLPLYPQNSEERCELLSADASTAAKSLIATLTM